MMIPRPKAMDRLPREKVCIKSREWQEAKWNEEIGRSRSRSGTWAEPLDRSTEHS